MSCYHSAVILKLVLCFFFFFVFPPGVGQSEFAVADMVDMFVLLIPPAGGDELQVSENQPASAHLWSWNKVIDQ